MCSKDIGNGSTSAVTGYQDFGTTIIHIYERSERIENLNFCRFKSCVIIILGTDIEITQPFIRDRRIIKLYSIFPSNRETGM